MEQALLAPTDPARWGSAATDLDVYAALADAALAANDQAALEQYAPMAHDSAQAVGHRLYQAVALRALGVADSLRGREAAAKDRLDQALDLFEALGARWQLARTLALRARLSGGRGDEAIARANYQRAAILYESIGASADAAEAARAAS